MTCPCKKQSILMKCNVCGSIKGLLYEKGEDINIIFASEPRECHTPNCSGTMELKPYNKINIRRYKL